MGATTKKETVNAALRDYVARRSVRDARPSSDHVSGRQLGSVAPVSHPRRVAALGGAHCRRGVPPLRADTCPVQTDPAVRRLYTMGTPFSTVGPALSVQGGCGRTGRRWAR
ncbi:type II toxin-antitoxin system VapB family antitoxin [Streptomyces sp. NPDC050548]|uniref:type II toxin-antitoxin system VapB family antitoxin n=1 Tax=Streptomyces sp. NPDC050548 TaxID=3365629 RepID=UPI003790AD4E